MLLWAVVVTNSVTAKTIRASLSDNVSSLQEFVVMY